MFGFASPVVCSLSDNSALTRVWIRRDRGASLSLVLAGVTRHAATLTRHGVLAEECGEVRDDVQVWNS